MKNFDIVKWAKEEQLALSKMDDNSKYVARYLECTLLPKLETNNNESAPLCSCGSLATHHMCDYHYKTTVTEPLEVLAKAEKVANNLRRTGPIFFLTGLL